MTDPPVARYFGLTPEPRADYLTDSFAPRILLSKDGAQSFARDFGLDYGARRVVLVRLSL